MALKKTVPTQFGFDAKDAYHRVESVTVNKDSIQFTVRTYADPGKASMFEKSFSCQYDLAGDNPIKQAYLHLKTHPEFDGAVDC